MAEMNNDWRPFITNCGGFGLDRASPYDFDLVDIRRGDDGEISTIDARKMHPATNVFGLYWRPARSQRIAAQVSELLTASKAQKAAATPKDDDG